MTGRIENLRAALGGKQAVNVDRQKTWDWIKANDHVLTQMLKDARGYKKYGDPMIRSVRIKLK